MQSLSLTHLSGLMSSGPKAWGCAWPHCQLVYVVPPKQSVWLSSP